METIRLYAPYVDTLERAYPAPRTEQSPADQQNSQTGALSEGLHRRQICQENADCVLPCTRGKGGKLQHSGQVTL